jgi:hypothetical protein
VASARAASGPRSAVEFTHQSLDLSITGQRGIGEYGNRSAQDRDRRPAGWQIQPRSSQLDGTRNLRRQLGMDPELFDAPEDIPVMARRVEPEILYRLLRSSLGPALRQFVVEDSRQARIRAVAH